MAENRHFLVVLQERQFAKSYLFHTPTVREGGGVLQFPPVARTWDGGRKWKIPANPSKWLQRPLPPPEKCISDPKDVIFRLTSSDLCRGSLAAWIRTHRMIGANPEKSDLVNFRGPDWRNLVNSVFCCFFLKKVDKMFPKSWFSKRISATPRGQLNWTGPIANSSKWIETPLKIVICLVPCKARA